MKKSVVHLHYDWNRGGPKALRGVRLGFPFCTGTRNGTVPGEQLTAFPDDATCRACLAKVDTASLPSPEPKLVT